MGGGDEAIGTPTEVEGALPTMTAMTAILGVVLKRDAGVESATTETEGTVILLTMAAEIFVTIATDLTEITFESSQRPARQTRQSQHRSPARYRLLPSHRPPQHLAPYQIEDRYPSTAPESHLLCLGHIATVRHPQAIWDPTALL